MPRAIQNPSNLVGVVGNIFYFGSLEDGFKIYPDLGAISNTYSGYYSNTETDWILVVKKANEVTTYTYVRYELLTSIINPRTGSCLGISIEFIKYYFADFELLRTEVIEKIWEAFLAEKVLLEKQETSGRVAFKSHNLSALGQYLDTKSQTIRNVIAETYGSSLARSDSIPDASDNPIHALHPQSASDAIRELFETYGVVKLSPRASIETQSVSQKSSDQIKALQRKIITLTSNLVQKNNDIVRLEQEIERLKYRPVLGDQSVRQELRVREKTPVLNDTMRKPDIWTLSTLMSIPLKAIISILLAILVLESLLFIGCYLYFSSINKPDNQNVTQAPPQIPNRLQAENTSSRRLDPPPNQELSIADLKALNKHLEPQMTANDIAGLAIALNPSDVGKAYEEQQDVFAEKLVEMNSECFGGRTKDAKLLCSELRHIPIYKRP